MTDTVAKLISLRVVMDWESRKVWAVKHQTSESISEYRWFRSEELARSHAAQFMNATVHEYITALPLETTSDLDEARRMITAVLDIRRRSMQELGYTYEPARG